MLQNIYNEGVVIYRQLNMEMMHVVFLTEFEGGSD